MVLAKKVALVKWQKPPELMTARTAPALVPSICLMLCTDPDRTGEAETCGTGSAEPGES